MAIITTMPMTPSYLVGQIFMAPIVQNGSMNCKDTAPIVRTNANTAMIVAGPKNNLKFFIYVAVDDA